MATVIRARRFFAAGLPLLRKELGEQGVSPRTFLLRSAFALSVFFVFAFYFLPYISGVEVGPTGVLGAGAHVFDTLVALLFAAVYLFLPPLMAATYPADRERGVLDLIWVTDLSPAEILLQKYLSRMVLMLTLLCVSLPLFAFAYAFGGLDPSRLWLAFAMLVLTCFQVGALSIMFSARCATTGQALVRTYLIGALIYLAPVIPLVPLAILLQNGLVLFCLFPPAVYYYASELGAPLAAAPFSLPAAVSIAVFLALGARFLGAQVTTPRRLLPHEAGNVRLGLVYRRFGLDKKIPGLPRRAPVAWREAGRWIFLQPGHASRNVLLAGGLLMAATCLMPVSVTLLWVAAGLLITLSAATAIVSERANQTLDVLLATPLGGREIVRQKFHGLRRVMAQLFLLFVPLAVAKCILSRSVAFRVALPMDFWPYLLFTAVAPLIYLPMLGYLGLWIGLHRTSRARAGLTAFFTVFLWAVVPLMLAASLAEVFPAAAPTLAYVNVLSPAYLVGVAEFGVAPPTRDLGLLLGLDFVFYATLLQAFRALCLRSARRLAG